MLYERLYSSVQPAKKITYVTAMATIAAACSPSHAPIPPRSDPSKSPPTLASMALENSLTGFASVVATSGPSAKYTMARNR